MKKVMIIEDDAIIAHIYRTRLEHDTYAVEICDDGQSGLDRVHEFNPDAILLDLMLPTMNGIEFLKKIRAQSKFASTPVVVFTNAYLPNMIQEANAAGASQIFNKATVTTKQLLDCFYSLIHGKERVSDSPAANLSDPPLSNVVALGETPGSPPPPSDWSYFHDERARPTPPVAQSTFGTAGKREHQHQSAFDSEVYDSFVAAKHETMANLRTLLQSFMKAGDEAVRDRQLLALYRKVHALTARAGLAKFVEIAQFSSALEVLLKELCEKPRHINVSTLRTIAQSVDFVGELFNVCEPCSGDYLTPKILVVDDEVLSRRAVVYALERGNFKSTSIEDATVALEMVRETQFDLIVLDIQMPALDGFELCKKIRAHPTNQNTPVLFVTGLTDFTNRAKATISGGTDFIAKPFFFIEVTIKAVTLILRKRLVQKAKVKAKAA